MAPRDDVARFRTNWQEEVDAAATYGALAKIERIETLAEVYRRLAAAEEAHIGFWESKLRDAGIKVPARRPSVRSRVTVWLAGRFGTQSVIPALTMKEQAGRHGYDGQPGWNVSDNSVRGSKPIARQLFCNVGRWNSNLAIKQHL